MDLNYYCLAESNYKNAWQQKHNKFYQPKTSFITLQEMLNDVQLLNANFMFVVPPATVISPIKSMHRKNHKSLIYLNLFKTS